MTPTGQLIALLRNDARASVASLAKALGVSRGTVQNRMARLQQDRHDRGLHGAPQAGRGRAAHARLHDGRGRGQPGRCGDQRAARANLRSAALYSTNGRWDIVAELRADSLEGFDRVLARIRLIEGISQTETSLLLSTFKF